MEKNYIFNTQWDAFVIKKRQTLNSVELKSPSKATLLSTPCQETHLQTCSLFPAPSLSLSLSPTFSLSCSKLNLNQQARRLVGVLLGCHWKDFPFNLISQLLQKPCSSQPKKVPGPRSAQAIDAITMHSLLLNLCRNLMPLTSISAAIYFKWH